MGLLDGFTVIDCATLFAGPMAATLMGDHGAEVLKVEHPRGDDARRWGKQKDVFPRIPAAPATIRFTPPDAVGAHTAEILSELGLSANRIAELQQAGTVV